MVEKPSLAIIGSGIAGLSAAWLFQGDYNVTVFEKADRLGMGQQGLDVATEFGQKRIDVPIRVFNSLYYPNLHQLCQQLDVDLRYLSNDSSFADPQGAAYFRYYNRMSGDRSASYVLPRPRQLPWLLLFLPDYFKFLKILRSKSHRQQAANLDLRSYLAKKRFSAKFRDEFIVPIMSAIATCSQQEILNFPALMIFDLFEVFMRPQAMRRWVGGTTEIEDKLSRGASKILYGAEVDRVIDTGSGVKVCARSMTEKSFDQVIIATEAFQAKEVIDGGDYIAEDRRLLDQIPYAKADMVVHSDATVMPESRRDWASVNYRLQSSGEPPSATLWINRSEPEFLKVQKQFFQTLNPDREFQEIHGRASFRRPICTLESLTAMRQLRSRQLQQSNRRIHYTGSYLAERLPLLENGVSSALALAGKFGIAENLPLAE